MCVYACDNNKSTSEKIIKCVGNRLFDELTDHLCFSNYFQKMSMVPRIHYSVASRYPQHVTDEKCHDGKIPLPYVAELDDFEDVAVQLQNEIKLYMRRNNGTHPAPSQILSNGQTVQEFAFWKTALKERRRRDKSMSALKKSKVDSNSDSDNNSIE